MLTADHARAVAERRYLFSRVHLRKEASKRDRERALLIVRKVMSAMTSGCHWIKSPPEGELSFWERTLLF
jgi:hypothetical protein